MYMLKKGGIDAYNPKGFLRKCCDAVGNSKQDRSIDLRCGHNLVKTSHALKLVDDVVEKKTMNPLFATSSVPNKPL
jgi:hypothetical protein